MLRRASEIALICLMALSATHSARAQAKDVAGSSDHPAVGRYEGAVITFHETKAYEEISLPSRGLDRGEKDNRPAWQADLAGKLTSIRYEGPGDRSVLEVMRNYEVALKAKGFTVRFFCRDQKECSPGRAISTFWNAGKGKIGMPTTWDTTAYMLAERENAEGRVTVGLLGVETKARAGKPLTPHVAVTVVESKPMESGKIKVVEAKEMETALARDGRIAIYGIFFDFDKAVIKPESRSQIDQLGTLLKDNPKLEILIVGHTDGKGAFDYNQSLSQRRAQAVSEALVSGHGIPAARLTPAGAGMVAPVASNRTEEGRARNRRVEIVERYKGD